MPGLAVLLGSGGHELAAVGLRSDGRVGHELADLLSTAAGDGDLRSHSIASARADTSTTANPPRSLLPGYGPSVTGPSVTTTLASSWSFSPPPNTHTPASLASGNTACAASATSGRSSSRRERLLLLRGRFRRRVLRRGGPLAAVA